MSSTNWLLMILLTSLWGMGELAGPMTKSLSTSRAKPEMAGKDEVTLPPILVDWNTLEKPEMGYQKLGLS